MELSAKGAQVRLERFIAEAAGAEAAAVESIALLDGGAVLENWAVEVNIRGGPQAGRHRLVLRTDPPASLPESLSRLQEFAVLKAVFEAGVTVPEPLWPCADREVIGRDFYLMRRIDGTTAGLRLVREESLGGDREALVERLGRELARAHTIVPPRADLDFLLLPEPSPALSSVAKYRTYLDSYPRPYPVLEWGLRWLERNAPEAMELVLAHHDFRTGNYMVDGTGFIAILDWEFAGWSDPMADLGWFCAGCWRFGAHDKEAGGIGSRESFYRGYQQASGREIDPAAVYYWEVMAHVRWAVIALQQGMRHLSGEQPSLELALTGRRPAELELDILLMTDKPRVP